MQFMYVNKRNGKKNVGMVNYDTTSLCKRSFFKYVTRRDRQVQVAKFKKYKSWHPKAW